MRRFIRIIFNVVLWSLLLHPYISKSTEIEKTQLRKDILSADFIKTDLELSLLGTIIKEDVGTAIIKNLNNGKLKIYAEGEVIGLVSTERVELVHVSDCTIIIERRGTYETLSCSRGNSTDLEQDGYVSEAAIYRIFSPLAKYKIVSRSKDNNSESPMFKSNYESEIITASKKHGLDPYLVKAVIKAESNFNPLAVSPKNAMGIMQLVPETARDYGVRDPFDPEENIDGGSRFLKDLINYFNGDLKLALAAYNAGRGSVIRYGFRIPPYSETVDYVDRVLGYYSLLKWNRYEAKR